MWIHRFAGTSILILTLTLGFMAFKRAGNEVVNSWHTIIGFIITCVVTVLALGGVFTRSMMNRLRWRTNTILKIKRGH